MAILTTAQNIGFRIHFGLVITSGYLFIVTMATPVTIGNMRDGDKSAILAIFREEGWPADEEDMALTLSCFGKEDMIVARLHSEVVGHIGAYRQTNQYGYISYFIVKREYRGEGLGKMLFERAVEHLEGRTVILDSVPSGQDFYVKKGFFKTANNPNLFFATFNTDDIRLRDTFSTDPSDHVTGVNQDNIEMVMTYDMTLHPYGYRKHFKRLVMEQSTIAYCYLDEGKVNGIVFFDTRINSLGLYAGEGSIEPLMQCMMTNLKESTNLAICVYIRGDYLHEMCSCLAGFGVSISPELQSSRMSTQQVLPPIAKDVRCVTGTWCSVI